MILHTRQIPDAPAEAAGDDRPDALRSFEDARRSLFGIAYRMLGSVREAEDILQDAYIRWHGVNHAEVRNPPAYLARLVTHLSINALKAAHRRRVDYVGPWLPEPLLGDAAVVQPDAAEMGELADELSTAFLLLLERLTPVERAIFVLRESFDFPYSEIAGIVGKTEANCRQIERRARAHLAGEARARPADPAEHDRLLASFLAATRDGDVSGLVSLLAHDAVAYTDSGGKVPSARNPVRGAMNVARLFTGLVRKATERGEAWEVRPALVNGATGILAFIDGELRSVMRIHVEDGLIRNVFTTTNPDKLPRLDEQP
jgi:RNA polymerase sigma-70 factor (ECF subfamily)